MASYHPIGLSTCTPSAKKKYFFELQNIFVFFEIRKTENFKILKFSKNIFFQDFGFCFTDSFLSGTACSPDTMDVMIIENLSFLKVESVVLSVLWEVSVEHSLDVTDQLLCLLISLD